MAVVASMLLGMAAAAGTSPPPMLSVTGVEGAAGGPVIVHVALLNPGREPRIVEAHLPGTLHSGGRDVPVDLVRRGEATEVPGGGYAIVDYALTPPDGAGGQAVLSLGSGPDGYAFALGTAAAPMPSSSAPVAVAQASSPESPPSPSSAAERRQREPATRDTPFLGNVFAYEPTYGAFGHGTNTDGKIQISFAYQLFGDARAPQGKWWEGFRFGYTQKMFWDVEADSQPFRDVNYHPEIFYLWQGPVRSNGVSFSAQAGADHESNGRDGAASRAIQTLYIEPRVSLPIGGDYHLDIGPRLMHYAFGRDNNPDLPRYRGHQQLALAIGSPNGFKLSTTSRLNFGSGKGSVDALLSYPVTRIWHDLPVYVVVQGFTGYGEDMLDYDRKVSRIRIGIGLTR
jgi:phospholipase A1/A2